jgi:[ribosomal protein S18]-alanine N-acetyltransferase
MRLLPKSSSVSIKAVGPFDLGRLARLHRGCFDDPWGRADLAHLLALPGGFGLIARLFGRSFAGLDSLRGVGFALCRVVRDESELLSIGVAPAHRRKGIGGALLRAAMARCLQAGAGTMFLEVAVDNGLARELYEAHGFNVVGRREGYYLRADGSRASAFTLRCDLADALAGRTEPATVDRV